MKSKLLTDITYNNLGIMKFNDLNSENCSIQESSKSKDAIWIGVNGFRMHISKETLNQILPYLQEFAIDGIAISKQEQFQKLYGLQHSGSIPDLVPIKKVTQKQILTVKSKRTHCSEGHDLTVVQHGKSSPRLKCLTCERERGTKRRAAKKLKQQEETSCKIEPTP